MAEVCVICLILSCVVVACVGHLCIISPHQRGTLDVSTSGNPSCFRHGAPCGGQAAGNPGVTWTAGSNVFIKWQQNYNHYSVGFPGYMDLALAPQSSSNFELLSVTADTYAYSQDHRKNYTVLVKVPDMECDHCVLRARYNAHKPGEHTFYQCSDVRITKTQRGRHFSPRPMPRGSEYKALNRAYHLVHKRQAGTSSASTMYGLSFNPNDPNTVGYVTVDTVTGNVKTINQLNFGVGQSRLEAFNPNYIADGVVAVDSVRGLSLMMNHISGINLDQPPNSMMALGTTNGTVVDQVKVAGFDDSPFSAVMFVKAGTYITFSIEESTQKPGSFFFVVGQLDNSGMWKKVIQTPDPEDTYVNFQWAEYDSRRQKLFVLMGNENDADHLTARIYTFNIDTLSFFGLIDLDVSKFTFMSFHVNTNSEQLLSISPGLFNATYPSYSLIALDPFTGEVQEIAKITQPGIFEKSYTGTIFGGLNESAGTMTHVFRVADAEVDVVATIFLSNMTVAYSQLTNLRHIHNLAMMTV